MVNLDTTQGTALNYPLFWRSVMTASHIVKLIIIEAKNRHLKVLIGILDPHNHNCLESCQKQSREELGRRYKLDISK